MKEILLKELEDLRISIEAESFGQPIEVVDKYQRANEMLDDCKRIVERFFDEWGY